MKNKMNTEMPSQLPRGLSIDSVIGESNRTRIVGEDFAIITKKERHGM